MADEHNDEGQSLVEKIVAEEVPPDAPADEASERAYFQRRERELRLRRRAQDLRQRDQFATSIFQLVVVWLLAVFALIVFDGLGGVQGFGAARYFRIKFNISDQVIIALVSGTTVNIIAIFVIVVRNLFPRRDGDTKDD